MAAHEALSRQDRARELNDRETAPVVEDEDADEARRHACLEQCLGHLATGQRELSQEHYADERRVMIDHRSRNGSASRSTRYADVSIASARGWNFACGVASMRRNGRETISRLNL